MCIPFCMCNSGFFGVCVIMQQLCICVCEKPRQRWRVLHVHWQLYRLCGSWGEQDYGKGSTHTYRDTLELAIVPDSAVRWGPRFSVHIINRNKLVPSKHTYNLLKRKAELLRVKRGRRGWVYHCNYLSGQLADLKGPERLTECVWKKDFMGCLRLSVQRGFTFLFSSFPDGTFLFRSEYVARTVECDILRARWHKKMHPINIICTYICVLQPSEQIQLTFLSFPFSLMNCSLKLNVVFLHNYTFQMCFAQFDSTTAKQWSYFSSAL